MEKHIIRTSGTDELLARARGVHSARTKTTHFRTWKSGKSWLFGASMLTALIGGAVIPEVAPEQASAVFNTLAGTLEVQADTTIASSGASPIDSSVASSVAPSVNAAATSTTNSLNTAVTSVAVSSTAQVAVVSSAQSNFDSAKSATPDAVSNYTAASSAYDSLKAVATSDSVAYSSAASAASSAAGAFSSAATSYNAASLALSTASSTATSLEASLTAVASSYSAVSSAYQTVLTSYQSASSAFSNGNVNQTTFDSIYTDYQAVSASYQAAGTSFNAAKVEVIAGFNSLSATTSLATMTMTSTASMISATFTANSSYAALLAAYYSLSAVALSANALETVSEQIWAVAKSNVSVAYSAYVTLMQPSSLDAAGGAYELNSAGQVQTPSSIANPSAGSGLYQAAQSELASLQAALSSGTSGLENIANANYSLASDAWQNASQSATSTNAIAGTVASASTVASQQASYTALSNAFLSLSAAVSNALSDTSNYSAAYSAFSSFVSANPNTVSLTSGTFSSSYTSTNISSYIAAFTAYSTAMNSYLNSASATITANTAGSDVLAAAKASSLATDVTNSNAALTNAATSLNNLIASLTSAVNATSGITDWTAYSNTVTALKSSVAAASVAYSTAASNYESTASLYNAAIASGAYQSNGSQASSIADPTASLNAALASVSSVLTSATNATNANSSVAAIGLAYSNASSAYIPYSTAVASMNVAESSLSLAVASASAMITKLGSLTQSDVASLQAISAAYAGQVSSLQNAITGVSAPETNYANTISAYATASGVATTSVVNGSYIAVDRLTASSMATATSNASAFVASLTSMDVKGELDAAIAYGQASLAASSMTSMTADIATTLNSEVGNYNSALATYNTYANSLGNAFNTGNSLAMQSLLALLPAQYSSLTAAASSYQAGAIQTQTTLSNAISSYNSAIAPYNSLVAAGYTANGGTLTVNGITYPADNFATINLTPTRVGLKKVYTFQPDGVTVYNTPATDGLNSALTQLDTLLRTDTGVSLNGVATTGTGFVTLTANNFATMINHVNTNWAFGTDVLNSDGTLATGFSYTDIIPTNGFNSIVATMAAISQSPSVFSATYNLLPVALEAGLPTGTYETVNPPIIYTPSYSTVTGTSVAAATNAGVTASPVILPFTNAPTFTDTASVNPAPTATVTTVTPATPDAVVIVDPQYKSAVNPVSMSDFKLYMDIAAPIAPVSKPSIDTEKTTGATTASGVGNNSDSANNVANDADTLATADQLSPKATTTIGFEFKNNGLETLVNVKAVDSTSSGTPVAFNNDWKLDGGTTVYLNPTDNTFYLDSAYSQKLELAPNSQISGTGTLPAQVAGTVAADTVTVSGTGKFSALPVSDHDFWNGQVATLTSVIGNFTAAANGNVTVSDLVKLSNLQIGASYQVSDVLVDASGNTIATASPVTVVADASGNATATLSFTVTNLLAAQIGKTLTAQASAVNLTTTTAPGITDTANYANESITVPTPSVDTEKTTGPTTASGAGNNTDAPNNVPNDADTKATASQLSTSSTTTIGFEFKNNGTEALVEVKAVDTTTSGIALTFNNDWKLDATTQVYLNSADNTFYSDAAYTNKLVLAVNSQITGTGTLPIQAAGSYSADDVTITANGQISGKPVSDKDSWNGNTPALTSVIGALTTSDATTDTLVDTITMSGLIAGDTYVVTDHLVNLTTNAVISSTSQTIVADATGAWTGNVSFTIPKNSLTTNTNYQAQASAQNTSKGTPSFSDTNNYASESITTPAPSIDVEKGDTANGDTIGSGSANANGLSLGASDSANNAGTGDRDTVSDALALGLGSDTPLVFNIKNNGNENLTEVTVADITLSGNPIKDINGDGLSNAKDITWMTADGTTLTIGTDGYLHDANGVYVFDIGATITGTATLVANEANTIYQDTVHVNGVGEVTGTSVSDSDTWYGSTGSTHPNIDIVKTNAALATGPDGLADNANTAGINDHDTASTGLTIAPGATTLIYFRITNTGDEPLTNISFSDVNTSDDASHLIAQGVAFTFKGQAVSLNAQGYFAYANGSLVTFNPGEFIAGSGTLEALSAGIEHGDLAHVTGSGIYDHSTSTDSNGSTTTKPTGSLVSDSDAWYGSTSTNNSVPPTSSDSTSVKVSESHSSAHQKNSHYTKNRLPATGDSSDSAALAAGYALILTGAVAFYFGKRRKYQHALKVYQGQYRSGRLHYGAKREIASYDWTK